MPGMPATPPSRHEPIRPPVGMQDGIAAHAGPVNGHDPARDPMEIPEFLRRVH